MCCPDLFLQLLKAIVIGLTELFEPRQSAESCPEQKTFYRASFFRLKNCMSVFVCVFRTLFTKLSSDFGNIYTSAWKKKFKICCTTFLFKVRILTAYFGMQNEQCLELAIQVQIFFGGMIPKFETIILRLKFYL